MNARFAGTIDTGVLTAVYECQGCPNETGKEIHGDDEDSWWALPRLGPVCSFIVAGIFAHPRPTLYVREGDAKDLVPFGLQPSPLLQTGIICSPTWVLNQDDDEGEDEHDNEADGLVKCGDCKGSGWYIGLNAREHCTECDGAGWVPK